MKEFDYYIFIDYSENLIGYLIIDKYKLKELVPKISKFAHYNKLRYKSAYLHSIKKVIESKRIMHDILKLKIREIRQNLEIYADVLDVYLISSISNNCFGENTSTLDCSFNFLSPENIGQLSFKANAKYGESLKSSLIASDNLSKNSEEGIKSICSLMNNAASDNSSCESFVSDNILSNLLLISANKNSGATNSSFLKMLLASKTLNGLPFLINEENITFASTTNNIVYSLFNNASYLLAKDKLTSSANSSALFWDSLDLSTIDLILVNLSNLSFSILPTTNCQFILETELNSSNSLGISIYVCTIKGYYKDNYINLSTFELLPIKNVYSLLSEGKEVYFLNSENQPVRVKSIEKVPYSSKIYDVDVPNDVVLVRRGNGSEIWSGNSNNGTVSGGAVWNSSGKLLKGKRSKIGVDNKEDE